MRRAWGGGWQERWALGEFLKIKLVYGVSTLQEPGKCRETQGLTAFVGHAAGGEGGQAASWRSGGKRQTEEPIAQLWCLLLLLRWVQGSVLYL